MKMLSSHRTTTASLSLLLLLLLSFHNNPVTAKLSNVCGNATLDLQDLLVNATADWQKALMSAYNVTELDEFCSTPHFTSSCALDFDQVKAEVAWRAACVAAGGVEYNITRKRYRCKESSTDYVRLLNFIGHSECVPPATECTQEELDENHDTLVKDDAAFWGSLLDDADCSLEDKYIIMSGGTYLTMQWNVIVTIGAAVWIIMWHGNDM